ncbi:arsenic resistance protein [Deltaproteobacteria bacterium]|nr:arsenic resistance protein [Deltaproteobacteria bacterium]
MGALSKLQPVFIIVSALAGVVLGGVDLTIEQQAGNFIEIFLMLMLFFIFLGLDLKEISKTFMNLKFSIAALAINFIWTPGLAFGLAIIFLPAQIDWQIGFIMLLVTPCTDWYLIFTGLANGNVTLGASILPVNLILQIILLPAYLFIFMGQTVELDVKIIVQSLVFILFIPLTAANSIKIGLEKINWGHYLKKILKKNDEIQFVLLCLAIISMFASQGSLLLANLFIFIKLLLPLILFFVINLFLALGVGQKLKLPFPDIIALIFTTLARNSPVSLALAIITFPTRPIISLVLVMGPLIELPVLAIKATLLKKIGAKRPAANPPGG